MVAVNFINATTTSGIILNAGITNFFGTEFIMMIFFILILLAVSFAFKMPIELSVILLIPMILYFMAQNVLFIAIGGIALLLIAFWFAYWLVGNN